MHFTILDGLEHVVDVVAAVSACWDSCLSFLNDESTVLSCHLLELTFHAIYSRSNPSRVVLAPLLMHDETLRADENVSLIVVAPVDVLPAAVPTATDVKLQLAEVRHLVVRVERAQEQGTAILE